VRLTLSILLLASLAGAARADCYPESAQAAQTTAGRVQDWPDLYKAFTRFGMCEDGAAVTKAFSTSVARLLAEQWNTVGKVNQLAKAHPKFGKFVLRHIDQAMTADQADTVAQNASDHCPTGAQAFCASIISRTKDTTTRS
jgi:hypothetical protein